MAIPATTVMIRAYDDTEGDINIMVTGYQWKWQYKYLEDNISFFSNLATSQEEIDNQLAKGEYYLREVDEPLVIPINTRIRFLITGNDVIHSWWIPDFAVKQDAVPGFINEAWTRVDEPGLFRGQCAEFCGKDHAFMPIVVEVQAEADFDQWLEDQRLAIELASGQAVADRAKTWAMTELMEIGEQVFVDHCATCHELDGSGQGSTYPALAGGEIPNGPMEAHIDRVLNGAADTEMQAWAPQLSDLEIASVITYERNAFGNETADLVQPITIYESR